MPEAVADIGFSSTFAIESGVVDAFDVVADVTSIGSPALSRDVVDVTHLNSPDGHKEYIPGIKDSAEAKIGLNFSPALLSTLMAAYEAGTGRFQITLPDGSTLTFKGVVTGLEVGEITNDKMTATFSVKPNGQPVLVVA